MEPEAEKLIQESLNVNYVDTGARPGRGCAERGRVGWLVASSGCRGTWLKLHDVAHGAPQESAAARVVRAAQLEREAGTMTSQPQ